MAAANRVAAGANKVAANKEAVSKADDKLSRELIGAVGGDSRRFFFVIVVPKKF